MSLAKSVKKPRKSTIDKRIEIYDAAMALIVEHGFDNVTINDICDAAGITVGSFYHHFVSKDEILIVCLEAEDKEVLKEVQDMDKKGTKLSYCDRIIQLLVNRTYLGTSAKSLDFSINFGISVLKRIDASSNSPTRELYKAALNYLKLGRKAGEFKSDIDLEFTLNTLFYYTSGLIRAWQLSGGKIDAVGEAHKALRILLDAIAVAKQIPWD